MNYRCPICSKELKKIEKSLVCPNKHCFDFSKSGYINLLTGNNTKSHGDNRMMVQARSEFLNKNYYQCLIDAIITLLKEIQPKVLVDAGCGEGYYTRQMKQALEQCEVYGFDLSKDAIHHASKQDKLSHYAISSIFSIPLFDHSTDFITSLFAPIAWDEFDRLLKKEGYLLVVSPAPHHLFELKESIYEHPYLNEMPNYTDTRFKMISQTIATKMVHINTQKEIQSLFEMTPYYYKTSLEDKKKLEALNELDVKVEFLLTLFKKA